MQTASELASADPVELPTRRSTIFEPPKELAELRERAAFHRLRFTDGHVGWLKTDIHPVALRRLCTPAEQLPPLDGNY